MWNNLPPAAQATQSTNRVVVAKTYRRTIAWCCCLINWLNKILPVNYTVHIWCIKWKKTRGMVGEVQKHMSTCKYVPPNYCIIICMLYMHEKHACKQYNKPSFLPPPIHPAVKQLANNQHANNQHTILHTTPKTGKHVADMMTTLYIRKIGHAERLCMHINIMSMGIASILS